MIKKYLIALLITIFSYATYAENNNTITVSPDNPKFNIELKSNPSTGYTWQIKKMDKKLISYVGMKYIRANSQLIGSSGKTILTFKLKKVNKYPKTTELILYYSQKWSAKQGILKKFTISIE